MVLPSSQSNSMKKPTWWWLVRVIQIRFDFFDKNNLRFSWKKQIEKQRKILKSIATRGSFFSNCWLLSLRKKRGLFKCQLWRIKSQKKAKTLVPPKCRVIESRISKKVEKKTSIVKPEITTVVKSNLVIHVVLSWYRQFSDTNSMQSCEYRSWAKSYRLRKANG